MPISNKLIVKAKSDPATKPVNSSNLNPINGNSKIDHNVVGSK